MTPASTQVTLPVPTRAGAVPTCVKDVPPSVERWMTKPVSVVALSRQVRLTFGPAWTLAARLVGAAAPLMAAVDDTDVTVIPGNSPP